MDVLICARTSMGRAQPGRLTLVLCTTDCAEDSTLSIGL
jgi:hypothetical protein